MSWYTDHAASAYISWTEVSGDLSPGTGDFSLLARIEADTVTYGPSDQGTIISREFTAFELQIYQGNLGCYVGGVSNNPTPMAISTGRHSVGLRRSAGSLQLWLNGSFSASATNNANASGSSDLQVISRPGTPSTNLAGRIQDAGLWLAALTDGEMASYHAGFPAKRIRPQSLKWNPPLVRNIGDARQARTAASSGANLAVAAHLRSYGF